MFPVHNMIDWFIFLFSWTKLLHISFFTCGFFNVLNFFIYVVRVLYDALILFSATANICVYFC